MRARAFFGSKKLMVPGAILGATFYPGFSEDLSRWRLIIDDEGNLFQDVDVWQWTEKHGIVQEQRQEQVILSQNIVIQLVLKVEEIDFMQYQDSYTLSGITDLPTYKISYSFGKDHKTVETDNRGALVYKGNQDVRGFHELWQAIHQYAPFPQQS